MLLKKVFAVVLVALFATMGTLVAQEKYAIIIGGNMNPDTTIPATEQWNGGNGAHPQHGFNEFWNDAYLAWEMLITDVKPFGKGYTVDNVHVLFDDGDDFTFYLQDPRYQAGENGHYEVVDENANETTIINTFGDLATTITEDDFLFVWIMSHGGSDATGHYFYSYDNHKIYDYVLAGWLNGIAAHKKTVFLSFPKSGGFIPELEAGGNIIISACGELEGASRADDVAPNMPYFEENEVLNNITYNHGEVNYHLTSSLTGFTPKGEVQYAGIDLSEADVWAVDGFISIYETKLWANAKKTTTETIGYVNPPSEVYLGTTLEYPTLLYWEISEGDDVTVRGLVGISDVFFVEDQGSLTIKENSEVYLTAPYPDVWVSPGSEITFEDHVMIESLQADFQFFILSEDVSIGDNLTVIAPSYNQNSIFSFYNANADISLNSLTVNNCNIRFNVSSVSIRSAWFEISSCKIEAEISRVITSFFASSYVRFDNNTSCQIDSCNLFHYLSDATESTASEGIIVDNCDAYGIDRCLVSSYLMNGIRIINSGTGVGLHNITNNTITNNGHTPNYFWAGIRLYDSHADINGLNDISGSDIGIASLNNSHVKITGNKGAEFVHETQQIHDNSVNQVYATAGAFPYEFRFNAIYDEDNSCLVGYAPDPVGIEPNLEVIYNYWGTNFNPQEDLCPSTSYYSWLPVWNPPGSKPRTRLR